MLSVLEDFFLVAILGGRWSHGSHCGAWAISWTYASSYRLRSIGGRLLYVQALKDAEVLKVLKSILFEPLLFLAFLGIKMLST